MDLISVIVPVYNVEKYLDKCIESIVNQTYKNLEIILVDDGSPDNCPQICDNWAKKDDRIIVIHKENSGAGAARNAGIDIAKGKYIGFVDSDDYISNNMYEFLLGLFEDDVDIVECEYKRVYNFEYKFQSEDEEHIIKATSLEAMKYNINSNIFNQLAPVKLFSKKALEGVRYPVGNSIDDEFFTYKTIANCKVLVHSSKVLYAYYQNDKSVMHKDFGMWRLEAVNAQIEKKKFIEEFFPSLIFDIDIKIWQWCIHIGKLALKYGTKQEKKAVFDNLKTVTTDNSLSVNCIMKTQGNSKFLLLLAKLSLKLTCKICNILNL